MRQQIKHSINAILRPLGVSLVSNTVAHPPPGTKNRPIAKVHLFLEDIRARGFTCQGIIDIGANQGDWSRMAMSVFPESRYLLIEPQSEMAPRLEALCRENPNTDFVLAGVGSKEGELVQTIYEDSRGSTFMPKVDQDLLGRGKQRKTKIMTVDGLLKENPITPDLVKIDTQGFELEALRGASSCFGRTEIFILETSLYRFYEAMPTTREIIKYMGERGYEIYDITEYLRRPLDGALGQIDFAFARADGILRRSSKWSE